MKRRITFDNATEFSFIHQGFCIGSSRHEKKSMTDVRNEAKVLDKFDAISKPVLRPDNTPDMYPTGDPVREFTSGCLVLTNDELGMLRRYFESVPWQSRVSREVVKLCDKIIYAEEVPDIEPKVVSGKFEA